MATVDTPPRGGRATIAATIPMDEAMTPSPMGASKVMWMAIAEASIVHMKAIMIAASPTDGMGVKISRMAGANTKPNLRMNCRYVTRSPPRLRTEDGQAAERVTHAVALKRSQ